MSRRAVILFLSLGLAWGIPYLFIKVAMEELAPSVLVLARTGLAALLLVPLVLISRRQRAVLPELLRRWRPVVAYSVAEVVFPWLFLNRAEQTLSSSTAAILISAVPVVGVLIALATRQAERLGLRGFVGLLLGTVGVAALVGLDLQLSDLARSPRWAWWWSVMPSAGDPGSLPGRPARPAGGRRGHGRDRADLPARGAAGARTSHDHAFGSRADRRRRAHPGLHRLGLPAALRPDR